MKKTILLITILSMFFFCAKTNAQSEIDTTVNLDMMTVPNSPAFQLLGISPAVIDRPNTPSDFAFSLANATNNLSAIPKNYAIEFLPLSLFKNGTKSYEKFANQPTDSNTSFNTGQKLLNNITRTFIISSGFSTDDAVPPGVNDYIKTRSGIGFKVSLIRGKIDTEFDQYKQNIEEIRKRLAVIHKANQAWIDTVRNTDPQYVFLSNQLEKLKAEIRAGNRSDSVKFAITIINEAIKKRLDECKTERAKTEIAGAAELKKQIESVKFKRYGFMLDMAGGIVLGFRNDEIQNSIVEQSAFWFNGGYCLKKGFSFLALARLNTLYDATYDIEGKKTNLNLYDLGGKIEFTTNDNKFMLSAEGVIRFSENENVNHYSVNASYQVGKNQALTFSVGKSFAGPEEYGGNLIAALNYIKSFGTTRAVVPGEAVK